MPPHVSQRPVGISTAFIRSCASAMKPRSRPRTLAMTTTRRLLFSRLVRAGRDVEIGDLGIVNALSVLIEFGTTGAASGGMTSDTLNSSFSANSTMRLDCLSVDCDQQIHFKIVPPNYFSAALS